MPMPAQLLLGRCGRPADRRQRGGRRAVPGPAASAAAWPWATSTMTAASTPCSSAMNGRWPTSTTRARAAIRSRSAWRAEIKPRRRRRPRDGRRPAADARSPTASAAAATSRRATRGCISAWPGDEGRGRRGPLALGPRRPFPRPGRRRRLSHPRGRPDARPLSRSTPRKTGDDGPGSLLPATFGQELSPGRVPGSMPKPAPANARVAEPRRK